MKNYIVTTVLFLALSILAIGQDKGAFTQKDLDEASVQTVKLFKAKKYDEALTFAEKAVTIAKKLYGKKNIETANVLKNLGYVHYYKGDTGKAEDTFEDAFDIYQDLKNLSEEDKNSAAAIAENLASIKARENLLSSERYYKQAIVWREEAGGKDSAKLVFPLVGLANINYWNKDYEKSAELYERAITIGEDFSSTDETNFHAIVLRGGCAFKKAGKADEFEVFREKYKFKFPADASERAKKPINSGVVNGMAISLPKPIYPRQAGNAGAGGKVIVKTLINENGNVISACAENDANPFLIVSAEIAAYGARFKPTTLGGEPVKVSGTIVYNFVR